MVGFWIDSRYHNPKIIGIVSFQGVAEDQEGLQNGKGGSCPFNGELGKSFSCVSKMEK